MASATQLEDKKTERAHSGSFFHLEVGSHRVFTPEDFTDEHLQFAEVARDFMRNEVEPKVEGIEHKKPGVLVELMKQAAELGLFMPAIPEAHGGMDLDKTTAMLIAEATSQVGSFAVTYGAHTGIGTLPIVYYGTEAQKSKYLPKLATGEMLGAYALSESGSGSDALGARTVAKLTEDGKHYVLNGTKQWITNAAFADLFTVFAKIDGEHFSAFLVERKTPGVSIGNEERKLGIRGSSTCQLILEDVKIPVDNLLGEIGKGHRIAFNILNVGRWKLGAGSVGSAKHALMHGVKYAKERHQFKKPIASFGLIRQKIANAATQIYAGESMSYRTSGLIDQGIAQLDKSAPDYAAKAAKCIEEYTIEASILKVFGTEVNYNVVDEMLQIHGGNGYTEDYPLERMLRDARINRIFEGTNEINRLIIPATMFKLTLKGKLPLMEFTQQVIAEMADPEKLPTPKEGPLAKEEWAAELCKRAIVYEASYAAQKYLDDLKEKQRILGAVADCLIDLYGMDSTVSRAMQVVDAGKDADMHLAMTKLFCFEARARVFQRLRRIAMLMAQGDELDLLYDNLAKLDQRYRVDYMGLQETVASHMLDRDGYAL